jgi:glycyl-tRNA synthetase (class II)
MSGARDSRRVAYETLRDTVTLRHRDSMKQERVAIQDLLGRILPEL